MSITRGLRVLLTGLFTALLLLSLSPVGASSANISKSYRSDDQIINGSLVSLDAQKTDYVVQSNTKNGNKLLGVAVAANDSLLAVNPNDGSVQVATSGTATALVSDLNGSVKVGDQIGVSPFDGIGMKITGGGRVLGLAQTELNSNTTGAEKKIVKDASGRDTTIYVGFVRVTLGAGSSTASGTNSDTQQLNPFQKIAKNLTGHTVSTWRVVLSLVIVVVALISLITLTYAAIFGSIISVGRNPLGAHNVFKTLWVVLGMAILIAMVGAAAVYFLMK